MENRRNLAAGSLEGAPNLRNHNSCNLFVFILLRSVRVEDNKPNFNFIVTALFIYTQMKYVKIGIRTNTRSLDVW